MRNRYVLLVLMLLILPFVAGIVGAVGIGSEVTYPHDGWVYQYQSFDNTFTFDITNYDSLEPYYMSCMLFTQIGEDLDVDPVAGEPDILGYEMVYIDGNGSYSVTFPMDRFPYDDKQYYFGLYQTSELISFNMSSTDYKEHYFSFRDFEPRHLDMHAREAIRDGITYDVTTNSSSDIRLHTFMVDNEKRVAGVNNMIGYGYFDIQHTNDDLNLSWFYATSTMRKVTLYDSFTFYVGHEITGESYTDYEITIDDTCVKTLWSYDSDNTFKLYDNTAHDHVFYGVKVYFETFESSDVGGTHFEDTGRGTLGGMVRDYGESIGLPWLHILIALIICIIFVCIPLHFAIEYQKDLPNMIYGIAIIVAMTLNWGIGLIELWMFVFFILIIMLVVYMKYREVIHGVSEFIKPEVGTAVGQTFAEAEKAVKPVRKYTGIRISAWAQRHKMSMDAGYGIAREASRQAVAPAKERSGYIAHKPSMRITHPMRMKPKAMFFKRGRKTKKEWKRRPVRGHFEYKTRGGS